jgi:hypothetical protein
MSPIEQLQAMPPQGVALPFRGFIRYRESAPQLMGVRTQLIPIILLLGMRRAMPIARL